MSTIVNAPVLTRSDVAQRLSSRLSATLKAWWIAYLNCRMHQLAATQLSSMSDRELKDIDLHRGQIDAVLRGYVQHDRSLRYY